jgi:hypothetical protein
LPAAWCAGHKLQLVASRSHVEQNLGNTGLWRDDSPEKRIFLVQVDVIEPLRLALREARGFDGRHRLRRRGLFFVRKPKGAAKLLTRDEAQRIAANIAKLPELLREPSFLWRLSYRPYTQWSGPSEDSRLLDTIVLAPALVF